VPLKKKIHRPRMVAAKKRRKKKAPAKKRAKKKPGRKRIYLIERPKKHKTALRKPHKHLNYKEINRLRLTVGSVNDRHKRTVGFLDRIAQQFGVSLVTVYHIINGDTRWSAGSDSPMGKESQFKLKVHRFLTEQLIKSWHYKNDHKALRGIPDITLCCNSIFVSMELKASYNKVLSKANKSTWLQMFKLIELAKAGGIALIVYPENWKEVKELLTELSRSTTRDTNNIQEYSKRQLHKWSGQAKQLLGFSPKTGIKNREFFKKIERSPDRGAGSI